MGLRSRPIFPGVYVIQSGTEEILATRNLTPGKRFYGEQLLDVKDVEYRSWSPYRSKLAAAILRGLNELPLCDGDKVLYLGVASGTTCSHISDIVGEDGHIWGVEFASRPIRDLIQNLTNTRKNISPIFGDARLPGIYAALVPKVDIIYSDVAQPNQAEIVVKNAKVFLKKFHRKAPFFPIKEFNPVMMICTFLLLGCINLRMRRLPLQH